MKRPRVPANACLAVSDGARGDLLEVLGVDGTEYRVRDRHGAEQRLSRAACALRATSPLLDNGRWSTTSVEAELPHATIWLAVTIEDDEGDAGRLFLVRSSDDGRHVHTGRYDAMWLFNGLLSVGIDARDLTGDGLEEILVFDEVAGEGMWTRNVTIHSVVDGAIRPVFSQPLETHAMYSGNAPCLALVPLGSGFHIRGIDEEGRAAAPLHHVVPVRAVDRAYRWDPALGTWLEDVEYSRVDVARVTIAEPEPLRAHGDACEAEMIAAGSVVRVLAVTGDPNDFDIGEALYVETDDGHRGWVRRSAVQSEHRCLSAEL